MKKLIGFIVYNRNHTYCVKNIDQTFYVIDSLKQNVNKIQTTQMLNRKGIGVIQVMKN